jgi:Ca-activated chloride channel family protein
VLVSPTTNRDATKNAIDKLQVADRTATGEGIFTALRGHLHRRRGDRWW